MAGNLVYVTLRSRCQHGQDCTEDQCGPKCGLYRFDEQMDAPLLPWELREQWRIEVGFERLKAGSVLAEAAGE
jgi:hypothetical protein